MNALRLIQAAALCMTVALTGAAGFAQDTSELTPDQMRIMAQDALNQNRSRLALAVAEALLQRDPDDGFALIIKSRAARNLGKNDMAVDAARKAWRLAQSDSDRYASALVMAQALSSSGRRTQAQFWLRRAAHFAPSKKAELLAARDFRYVRSRNPWTTRLSFGVTPSSNINNGSKSDTMVIGGLPFELNGAARALSGLEYSYAASTRYRRPVAPGVELQFGAAAEGKSYSLSDDAKRQAPDLAASDLAYYAGQLSMGAVVQGDRPGRPLEANLTVGRNFYGGDHLSDYARADLVKTLRLDAKNRLRFSLGLEEQWRKDAAIYDSTALSGQAEWRSTRGNGDLMFLSVGLRDTRSDAGSVAHDARILAGAYYFAKPVLGAQFGLSAAFETRDYEGALFGGSPREDEKITLGASMFLPEYSYYGFAPEIGLTMMKNRSNKSLYESEDIGLSIGFRSSF